MNAGTDTTAATKRQVQAFAQGVTEEAERLKRSVDVLAATLAQRMSAIHGMDYRISIDHTPGIEFVLIVPRLGVDRPAKPRRGEIA